MRDSWPLAFLLTWTTFGTWLHGDERGSIDRHSRGLPSEGVAESALRTRYERFRMKSEAFGLSDASRPVVDHAIRELCARRDWHLSALNVRTNHVHAVVAAEVDPAIAMTACKAAATRGLVGAALVERGAKLWTRHGSTRWLWKESDVAAAWDYVVNRQ